METVTRDRLIVAPSTGVFEPGPALLGPSPASVSAGEVVGSLRCGRDRVDVASFVVGTVRQLMALPGERVRQYQPLVWLETP